MLGVNKLATGHNADDMAETVILNLLRGDIARSLSLSLWLIYHKNITFSIMGLPLSQTDNFESNV
jgi:tRNA(Ile)-lysidine synthase TilS/MesJ